MKQKAKTLGRLLGLLSPYWLLMVGAALCGACTVLANMGLLGASAVLISQAALMPPILDLMVLIVAVRFFGISRAAMRYVERYVTHDVTFRILKKLRVWFYTKIEAMAPANLQDYGSGRIYKQIINDVETLKFFYLRVLCAPLIALVVLAAGGFFLWHFSRGAAAALILFYLIGGVCVPVAVRWFTRGMARRQSDLSESLHTRLVDTIQGLGDLQAAGALKDYRKDIDELFCAITDGQKKLNAVENVTACLITWFSNLAMTAGIASAVALTASGELKGIYLAMTGLVIWACFEAVQPMPLALEQLEEGVNAASRLFYLADRDIPGLSPEEGTFCPLPETSMELRRVKYKYGGREQFELGELSFVIPQGARVAVVGPSGSGKSTILDLLLKFRSPEEGAVLIGGIDVKKLPSSQVRGLLGVLGQDPYLFHASVWENVQLARPEAGRQEVEEACKKAQIHDFICSLPDGYDTQVGEGGFKFSGGQRQRLALARLYLKDSPILILDECTQGLDSVTGRAVLEDCMNYAEGDDKTLFMITHSLYGLERMDEILVMTDGKIVERGTHESLLRENGIYTRLFQLEREQV